jgi:hypothetical protein
VWASSPTTCTVQVQQFDVPTWLTILDFRQSQRADQQVPGFR